MIGWLDCAAGASGDMLLGALVGAGAPLPLMQAAVDCLGVEPVLLSTAQVTRQGVAADKVDVRAPRSTVTRTWANIRGQLESADLAEPVRRTALDAFARLAHAEATAHRTSPEQVHFHEVGGLDALADIVGAAAGLHALGLTRLTAGTVALGSGMTRGEHGLIPVPGPAVLAILAEAGAPVWSGPAPYEMCTPTGAALLATVVTEWGQLPRMTVTAVGSGAGTRDLDEVPNVLRLVVGEPVETPSTGGAVVLETNVDDLDPRLWPHVLDDLLAAGASDAWLSPIVMKKGRPAYTLHVLADPDAVAELRRVVFSATSTIGLRQLDVGKHALEREAGVIRVEGQPVAVKVARDGGRVVNVSVEFEDVRAAATELGQPVKEALRAAVAAAHQAYPAGKS